MPNLNDNKFKKIQSESQKQGKSQEEYAAELDANRAKAKRKVRIKRITIGRGSVAILLSSRFVIGCDQL